MSHNADRSGSWANRDIVKEVKFFSAGKKISIKSAYPGYSFYFMIKAKYHLDQQLLVYQLRSRGCVPD